jgi:anti-anti-sigma factor
MVRGSLDLVTAGRLRHALRAARPRADLEVLELDLSRLTFCDLSGLRAVLQVREETERAGHRFVLVAADPYTDVLVTTLGLGEVLGYRSAGSG